MSGLPGIVEYGEVAFGPGPPWFGTRSGVHVVVNVSSVSPAGQAVIPGASEVVKAAIAGAVRAASANPPAKMNRDAVMRCVAIYSHFLLVCCTGTNRCSSLPAVRSEWLKCTHNQGNSDA